MSYPVTSPALFVDTSDLRPRTVKSHDQLLHVEEDIGDILTHVGEWSRTRGTPSMLSLVTAAPVNEDRRTLRRELPTVTP